MITATLHRAKKATLNSLKAGLVPFLHSSPGLGKSSLVKEIAAERKLKLIDIRLAQSDPTDLNGYPIFNKGTSGIQKAEYVPMDTFPLSTDSIPEGHNGWLLFMDEMSSAPAAVQAAAYKIVLDRMVGQHHLHKNCFIVAAGNLLDDNAVVEEMSTALQSRMIHIVVESDLQEFLKWGAKNNLDERIAGFLNYQPQMLHKFDPDHADMTFPCPRTWEFANRMLQAIGDVSMDNLVEFSGCVGEGPARDFLTYCVVHSQLPAFEEILANPTGFQVDEYSPSIKWATTMMISYRIDENNAKECLAALEHIGAEFAFVGMKTICNRLGNAVLKIPGMSSFFSKYGAEYLL